MPTIAIPLRPLPALAGLALSAVIAAWAAPAVADEPIETAVKAWVAAIDASPNWQASYGSLAVDAATGKATLSGLSVKSEKPGFSVSFTTVTIAGFHPTSDGTFAADEIDLDGGDIEAGVFSIRIADAVIAAPVLPESGGFAWDDTQPMLSAVHALGPLTRTIAASARAGSVAVVETLGGTQSATTYANVKVAGWRNGKVAAISAGPVRTDSPADNPLVSIAVATTETRDIDLNTLTEIYDPASYAGGVGDGVWRQVVGHVAYHGLKLTIPGIDFTIADAAADGFRMRQPKTPPLGAAQPAEPATDPFDALLRQLDAAAPYGLDRFGMTSLDLAMSGLERAHIDDMAFTDVTRERIGDFTLSGMAVALSDNGGTLNIGKLAAGGIALPSSDALRAAMAAVSNGGDVDYSSLIPPLTYVELGGFNEALDILPPIQLDHFRVDLGNYADKVPTAIALDLAGLDVPAAMVPEDRARQLLATFGYDRVHLDAGGHLDWSDAGEMAVKDFHFGMKDAGAVSGAADLIGLKPADAEHLAAVKGALGELSLKSGTLTVSDDSIVRRVLAAQATRLNVDPDKFRDQFATGLPFMLMFLNNRDLQAKLGPVLQAFLRTGGSITAVANPAAPVPLAQVATAAETAPFTLFSLLSASVSGTPGPAPAAVAPVPQATTAPAAAAPAAPAPATVSAPASATPAPAN